MFLKKLALSRITLLIVAVSGFVGCPLRPSLTVFPLAFDFGATNVTDTLTIFNDGSGILAWDATDLPAWLTLSATTGTSSSGNPASIAMTVNRTLLADGRTAAEFTISSNGGDQTVAVSIDVAGAAAPTLSALPLAVEFGATGIVQTLTISNTGSGSLTWQLTEDISWLSLSATTGVTTVANSPVTLTASRSGLNPGNYSGNVVITSNGGEATIPVSITVPGPSPALLVTPLTINAGTTATFTIDNVGTGSLDYTITESIPWLTLPQTQGSITTEVNTITATIDRSGLAAGSFSGTLSVASNGGNAEVTVNIKVGPPTLVVTPTSLSFGQSFTQRLLTIQNGGVGIVNWTIDTSAFPTWLSVGTTSGAATTAPQGVLVNVDRTGLAPGTPFTHTFTVASDGGSLTVDVTMTVGIRPVLSINTGAEPSSDGVFLANLGAEATSYPMSITNSGTGTLNWEIDRDTFPVWMTMSKVAGSLSAGAADQTTITVDRSKVSPGGYTVDIPIESNGGFAVLEVQMSVPLRPIIGTDTAAIDLGLTDDSSSFLVANVGDDGTRLLFRVESDKDWLFFNPPTGISIGTSSIVKDVKVVSIAVDRGGLDSTSAVGTITIRATDFEGEVITDIEPRTVTITVEAASLSFEGPLARVRIPSQVRFPFIMRDFRDDAILTPSSLIPVDAFSIVENGVVIDRDETEQFLMSGSIVAGAGLRTNVVILLDFSGSMYATTEAMNLPGTDSLQTLYADVISDFVDTLPDTWQIALMEFHDRDQGARVRQGFTTNKTTVKNALNAIVISDHGASELLPAVNEANTLFVDADFPLSDFDTADVRAMLLVSDGQRTTPPGNVLDTLDALVPARTRVYPIGWGARVNSEPLAELASESGGHYYTTAQDASGLPLVSDLISRLADLSSDLRFGNNVLGYTTLNETENTSILIGAAFNDSLDSPDQGLLQGGFEQTAGLAAIDGDVRLGQISMRTSGVSDGEATVLLRGEYIPRNINKFAFTFSSTEVFTVSKIDADDGGIVSDWTLTDLGGGAFSLTAPTPEAVLPYGRFGDMLRIDFASVAPDFRLLLTVDNTIYDADIETKFFIYPDSIPVPSKQRIAPAFPTPLVSPLILNFGTSIDELTFEIRNIGGSYPAAPAISSVELRWWIPKQPKWLSELEVKEEFPETINTTLDSGVDIVTVRMDRSEKQGVYRQDIPINYYAGDRILVDTSAFSPAISVLALGAILPPVLSVSPTTLSFGTSPDIIELTISNTGQSTMAWKIDTTTTELPDWLVVSPLTGNAFSGSPSVVDVSVNFAAATGPSGALLEHTFVVQTDFGSQSVAVTATKP